VKLIEATDGVRLHHLVLGDNLDVLKALVELQVKFKLILTDPPYGTGHARQGYDDTDEGWLRMIKPRLKLLGELLDDGGIILMHIDDNYDAHLRLLLDKLLGKECRFPVMVWERTAIRINSSRTLSRAHEYIVGYGKPGCVVNPEQMVIATQRNKFSNPDRDPRGDWRTRAMVANGQGYIYPIQGPKGQIATPPKGRGWSMKEETFREREAAGRVWWGKSGRNKSPQLKRYAFEAETAGMVPRTWLPGRIFGYTQTGSDYVKRVLGGPQFSSAKPLPLVAWLVERFSQPGDLILDCWAGSGTVAEATALVNGNDRETPPRRTFLIQRREVSEVKHQGGSYSFAIEDLTISRLRHMKEAYGDGYEVVEI